MHPLVTNIVRAKTKKRKIKMTPSDKQNKIEYLKELVILMLKADSRRGACDHSEVALSGLIRKVPTLNVNSTNARALKLRQARIGRKSCD